MAKRSLKEVVTEWQRQRRIYFSRLSVSGMTYEQIGKIYGITRQAVGQTIKK